MMPLRSPRDGARGVLLLGVFGLASACGGGGTNTADGAPGDASGSDSNCGIACAEAALPDAPAAEASPDAAPEGGPSAEAGDAASTPDASPDVAPGMDAAPDVVVLDSTTDVSVDTVIDTSTVPDVRAAVEASLPPEAGASCGPYVDVLYRLAGTFRIANTPFGAGDTTQMVGTNGSLPMFATAGATTPFTVVPFSNGFVRLRFPNVGTGSTPVPGTGAIRLLEWYMPNEFSVGMGMTLSPRVDTNVDHSAGLLGLVMNNIPANPTLSRACASVADGTLAGTALTWAACGVTPTGTTSFTVARAQAPAGMAAGCLRRMSVWGNIRCSAGGCGLVPAGSLGDQRATWDQPLRGFAFNSSNFATASFTMPEVQIPNDVNTTTWIAITSATPQRLECGTDASITCNEQCNATGCGP